jgi:hypothetical protein
MVGRIDDPAFFIGFAQSPTFVIASVAKQSTLALELWIASSQALFAMTKNPYAAASFFGGKRP